MLNYKLLDQIENSKDLKKLSLENLNILSTELREKTIEIVSKTGGHLGAGLGVVELTIALHYIFDTPKDLLIWDIGHQTYPHKILTGRKEQLQSLRQNGGISGFTKRSESIYDPFGAGHCSTSISAALGMAKARDLSNEKKEVIAVIGDGAMSSGMAYEAMNNAGSSGSRLFVILNDNEMSISPAVGAMNRYLSNIISSKPYLKFRNETKNFIKKFPKIFATLVKKTERNTKDLFNNGNFFEEMGFYYIGPIDGHNINDMVKIFANIRDDETIKRPVLLHVITEKGKGFYSPEKNNEKYHAVAKFDPKTFIQAKSISNIPNYTSIFANHLIKLAKNDDKIIAITAAMPSGTGLDKFAQVFPERMFDVGIAEQHAVTFAAGLACQNYKPFVAIYSTFLQRAYDQIVHDVAIQSLPVRFAIDRAGFVGADGPTHAGSFDIAYLTTLPNFVVMAPSDENELALMMNTSLTINDRPSAFRYPRGIAKGVALPNEFEIIEIGKGRILQQGTKIAILNLGTRLNEAEKLAIYLQNHHQIKITIADARFAKPLDLDLIKNLALNHELLITLEEGSIGGFGSHVLEYLANNNLTSNLVIKTIQYPDSFVEQNEQEAMSVDAGLCFDNLLDIIQNQFFHKDKIKIVA